ncbi:MAG: calcium-binding protein [Planctomycetota bacterium]
MLKTITTQVLMGLVTVTAIFANASSAMARVQVWENGTTLQIQGSNQDDYVIIDENDEGYLVMYELVNGKFEWQRSVRASLIDTIQFDGNDGNDYFQAAGVTSAALNASGGGGADIIFGTESGDYIEGGMGEDHISGLGGDDVLYGHGQFDGSIRFGANDTLIGGRGDDYLRDDDGGDDTLGGNQGNDTLLAGAGNDDLFGGEGNDHLSGGDGDDRLWGGYGRDVLTGQAGADESYAQGDNTRDTVYADWQDAKVIDGPEDLVIWP